MFRIESWTAGGGWREYHRVPVDIEDARDMIRGFRARAADKQWRVVQVLDI